MAELHKILATVKTALESSSGDGNRALQAPSTVPIAPSTHRAELATRFARELEAVGGRFLGIMAPSEVPSRVVVLARELGAKLVAIGDGVSNDPAEIADALGEAGVAVMRTRAVVDAESRDAMRERLARADLGIAEAHCAIASTGTFAVLSSEGRPSSLTLLPPASLIIVQIDRVVTDLAECIAALGAEMFETHRTTLITGPSRTADIEKMIVLGVHGPKSLHAIVVWPHEK